MKKILLKFLALAILFTACKSEKEPSNSKESNPKQKQVLPYREGKLWGLADENANILVKPQYTFISFAYGETNPNLFAVFQKGKWGVIDTQGKIIIPIQFWRVNILPNCILVGDTSDDKIALYDTKGKLLLPAQYDNIDYVKPFDEKWRNLLLLHQKGKVGIYDISQEKTILPCNYELTSIPVSNADAEVFTLVQNGKAAFFDTKGKQVSDFKYLEYGSGSIMSEGYAKVQCSNGLWGVVDKNGKEVVPCQYKNMGISVCNSIISFEGKNGKWGYLNVSNSKEIVKPEYDRARDFSSGFGEVEKNRKVGFVDATGKVVVPLEYDGALNAQQGICFMMKKGNWFPIRLSENKPINNEIYAGGNFDFKAEFANVSCKNENSLMQGLINTKGEVVVPCRPSDFGFTIYPQNAILQENEKSFVVFSLPDGKELIKATKQPQIEKDFMLIAQNDKYMLTDLKANKILEINAPYVTFASGYLLVSNKEPDTDDLIPRIDDSGNLVAPPLEKRYIPDVEAVKGIMSIDGKKFWKD